MGNQDSALKGCTHKLTYSEYQHRDRRMWGVPGSYAAGGSLNNLGVSAGGVGIWWNFLQGWRHWPMPFFFFFLPLLPPSGSVLAGNISVTLHQLANTMCPTPAFSWGPTLPIPPSPVSPFKAAPAPPGRWPQLASATVQSGSTSGGRGATLHAMNPQQSQQSHTASQGTIAIQPHRRMHTACMWDIPGAPGSSGQEGLHPCAPQDTLYISLLFQEQKI